MRITDMITQEEYWIYLIFYQLLPTTFVGNEWGQQMRIQILILGLKGLREFLFGVCDSWESATDYPSSRGT